MKHPRLLAWLFPSNDDERQRNFDCCRCNGLKLSAAASSFSIVGLLGDKNIFSCCPIFPIEAAASSIALTQRKNPPSLTTALFDETTTLSVIANGSIAAGGQPLLGTAMIQTWFRFCPGGYNKAVKNCVHRQG